MTTGWEVVVLWALAITGVAHADLSAQRGHYHPAWSPDGTQIVYAGDDDGDFEVFLYDLGEGTEVNLSRSPSSYDGIPAFSPDGEWIAFESTRGGDRRIFVMRADGTGVRRVSGQAGSSR